MIQSTPSSALLWQELERTAKQARCYRQGECFNDNAKTMVVSKNNNDQSSKIISEIIHSIIDNVKIHIPNNFEYSSSTSIYSTQYAKFRTFFPGSIRLSHSQNSICSVVDIFKTGMFGRQETEVYMNLFNEFCNYRASGTQATAFINKCLQVNSEIHSRYDASTLDTNSNYTSTCTMSTLPSRKIRSQAVENTQYHDVYFFGRRKEATKSTGMGCNESNTNLHRRGQPANTATKSDKSGSKMRGGCCSNTVSVCSTSSAQTKSIRGASTATNTMKAVSIKEDKPKKPCPAMGITKGDMTATVSHIRLGPREPCPVHGNEPCQGPKCIVASSGEEKAPVKVTTVTNPRRGVFELVIRKMTGAPLAKNELMLEWTPPPCRPGPCGGPCPIPCAVPKTCRPSKCKMIVCKPSPCKPKCCKKPCSLLTCKSRCKKCCKLSCCGKKCTPCGPAPCSIPCAQPCCGGSCSFPCKSSPCLRPCPVGRKKARKSRSQPKIRENRKRTSPCLNRSKACPVVRCRSMPAPCIGFCSLPPCPPRKCCSVSPCKPPKCCKSSCSVCCI